MFELDMTFSVMIQHDKTEPIALVDKIYYKAKEKSFVLFFFFVYIMQNTIFVCLNL